MRFLENMIEFFCWCWIFICPTLILGIAGFVIYCNYKTGIGVASFIGLSVLGVVLGIYFAERIRRSVGCTMFVTRISGYSDSQKSKKDESK